MAEQIPLDFEFRANKTFADYFPAANQEVVSHLQRCIAGTGEAQIFLWGHHGQGKSQFITGLLPRHATTRLAVILL
jgi:DnaA family protein